jgi:chromate transporter
MAVGHLRAGWAGAAAAWLGFTLPSAVLMVLAALAWSVGPAGGLTAATHGLLLVSVAIVAQAVGRMALTQCRTPRSAGLAWAAFAALLLVPGPLTLPVVLVLGAFTGLWGGPETATGLEVPEFASRRGPAVAALVLFAALAVGLPLARAAVPWEPLAWADAFYRTGAWVFGGGHVVLPWLNREVVQTGWVSSGTFLAGYGAAQALPGPLFTVAAFLGMATGGIPGALVALVAIFLPGFLLIGGVLPFWSRLRSYRRWRGAFAAASVTVVGVLAATLVHPIGDALVRPGDWVVAAGLVLLLEVARWPAWAVVLVGALAGPAVLLLG